MWTDALNLLEQAERLQRQFFHTAERSGATAVGTARRRV
jgi:hypothetical protein